MRRSASSSCTVTKTWPPAAPSAPLEPYPPLFPDEPPVSRRHVASFVGERSLTFRPEHHPRHLRRCGVWWHPARRARGHRPGRLRPCPPRRRRLPWPPREASPRGRSSTSVRCGRPRPRPGRRLARLPNRPAGCGYPSPARRGSACPLTVHADLLVPRALMITSMSAGAARKGRLVPIVSRVGWLVPSAGRLSQNSGAGCPLRPLVSIGLISRASMASQRSFSIAEMPLSGEKREREGHSAA